MEVSGKLLSDVKAINTGQIAEFTGIKKSTVNGALIGAGMGLIFGIISRKNTLLFMAGGALFGGFIANLISKKI